jgi:hypothetical protein
MCRADVAILQIQPCNNEIGFMNQRWDLGSAFHPDSTVNGSRWLDGVTFNMVACTSAHSDHPLTAKGRLLSCCKRVREGQDI